MWLPAWKITDQKIKQKGYVFFRIFSLISVCQICLKTTGNCLDMHKEGYGSGEYFFCLGNRFQKLMPIGEFK